MIISIDAEKISKTCAKLGDIEDRETGVGGCDLCPFGAFSEDCLLDNGDMLPCFWGEDIYKRLDRGF